MKSKKSTFHPKDGQVKDALFGEWGRGVVELEQPAPPSTVPLFQGAAGSTSNFINYHSAPTLTVNCQHLGFTQCSSLPALPGSLGPITGYL